MKKYQLTTRGWIFFGVLILLVLFLLIGVVSFVVGNIVGPVSPSPTSSPNLTLSEAPSVQPTQQTPLPSPSVAPSDEPTTNTQTDTASPSPLVSPSASPQFTDEPIYTKTPAPYVPPRSTPRNDDDDNNDNDDDDDDPPTKQPTAKPSTEEPTSKPTAKPTVKPTSTPKPTTTSKPIVSPKPSVSPSPSVGPKWANETLTILFAKNNAHPVDEENVLDELVAFLPKDLEGYIIMVEGYMSTAEVDAGLPASRLAYVEDILKHGLGLPDAVIRTNAFAPDSSQPVGRLNQRVLVRFVYVGNK